MIWSARGIPPASQGANRIQAELGKSANMSSVILGTGC